MQRRRFAVVAGGLTLILCLATSHAATYTVSPGQSIAAALSRLSGGDTLIIEAGTYREGNLTPPSGSSGAPTVVRAAAAGQVILQPGDRGIDTVFDLQSGRHDITIEGIVIDGSMETAYPVYGAPDVRGITLRNVEIRNGRASGGLLGGGYWTIENSSIHHNGVNCCATHSDDHGLYFSAGHSVIRNNTFEANACYNIQVYHGDDPNENVIEGNTFTGSKCGVTLTNGSGHIFRNNTIIDDALYYDRNALLIHESNTRIEGNAFVRINVIGIGGGNSASVQIVNNRLCDATIEADGATQSGNQTSCDNLPSLDRPPVVSQPPAPRLPAPRNLRLVGQP